MTPTAAHVRCVVVAVVAVVAALAFGEPWLVAAAVPFVLAVVLSWRPAPAEPPAVAVRLSTTRAARGESVDLTVEVPTDRLVEVAYEPGDSGLTTGPRTWTSQPRGLALRADHLGTRRAGAVRPTTWDDLLLHATVHPAVPAPPLRVVPAETAVRVSEALPSTLAYAGEHVARAAGPGVEFAGARRFGPGDRPRSVDWRLSTRYGTPWVRTTRREHSVRVVVLVDTTVAGELGRRLVDLGAQAAYGIARSYLERGDAVCLLEFGSRSRRTPFVSGRSQLPRLRDWLADLQPRRHADVEPTSPRPPAAELCVACTPLVEPTTSEALVGLRRSGASVTALCTVPSGGLTFGEPGDRVERVADQVWSMRRDAYVRSLVALGVPVVTWSPSTDLDAAIRSLARQARAPRLVTR